MEFTHFADAELARWRHAGPGPDRERAVRHIAECSSCASRYAAAMRTRPLETEASAESFDASEFAAVGTAIPDREARVVSLNRRRWTWIAVPAAAAALLVIALAIPRMRPREAETPQFRGAGVHALAPEGAVGPGAAFDWSSGYTASRFRIEVDGPAGRVYSGEFAAAPVAFPAALVDKLKPGATYSWTVTALDSDGQPVAASERRSFTLTGR